MHVFVTGASGSIGGTVAHKLLAAGHRVSGLVRAADKAPKRDNLLGEIELGCYREFLEGSRAG
ncbi:MAG: NAD-dependent epimerase/dehydratase family protein [Alphaproteobacteria bacterium]|nr:NAD-dependent epimerase/dehydratase family protein [Alphaproteobacteria bacterium]